MTAFIDAHRSKYGVVRSPRQAEHRFHAKPNSFGADRGSAGRQLREATHGEGRYDSPRPDEEGAVASRRLSMRKIRVIIGGLDAAGSTIEARCRVRADPGARNDSVSSLRVRCAVDAHS